MKKKKNSVIIPAEQGSKRTYFFDNFDEMINLIVDYTNRFPLKLDNCFMNYYSILNYLNNLSETAFREITKLKEV